MRSRPAGDTAVREAQALAGVDLDVKAGEIFAVLGPWRDLIVPRAFAGAVACTVFRLERVSATLEAAQGRASETAKGSSMDD